MVNRLREALPFALASRERPYQMAVSGSLSSGDEWDAERIVLEPETHYVIEYVSAVVSAPVGHRVTGVFVETELSTSGPWPRTYNFVPVRTTNRESGEDLWIVSQPTRLYADAFPRPEDEWQILVGASRERDDGGRADGRAIFWVTLSGRLTGRVVIVPGEPAPEDGPKDIFAR